MSTSRGKYEEISPNVLKVDRRYQRKEGIAKAERLVKEGWDWAKCGTITVSKRNGARIVVEGQHRTLAARILDLPILPCLVFEGLALKEEAKIFVDMATVRWNIHPITLFKSRLCAEEERAVETQKILARYGFQVSDAKNSTSHMILRCPGQAMRLYDSGDLADVLHLFTGAWPKHPLITKASFLVGFARFLRKWREISENPNILIKRMKEHDPQNLYTKAQGLLMYAASNSEVSALTKVFVDMWNHRRSGGTFIAD